jgi:hypothetical protein
MITQSEARQKAALLVLERMPASYMQGSRGGGDQLPAELAESSDAIAAELRLIEVWLRRRAVGTDKKLQAALDRELGRQVHPTERQARRLGLRTKER